MTRLRDRGGRDEDGISSAGGDALGSRKRALVGEVLRQAQDDQIEIVLRQALPPQDDGWDARTDSRGCPLTNLLRGGGERFRFQGGSVAAGVDFVVGVAAAQEGDAVEDAFLEPLQREIDDGRDVERD